MAKKPPEKPTYPEMPCHLAKLKPGKAPIEGCDCRVCKFFREP